ncbi:MAG: anti-sigma F factor [Firmicutes bacterium]|jgi:stage II sporulation protein AB (anti-sigma F factor)|nr:anti-sigma F factor [Bacillota bacterium]
METKNWIKLEFPSETVNVAFARTAIALFAAQLDLTLDELEDIKVAVSEAVSNSVIHGYQNNLGTIIVQASYGNGQLQIVVEDFGQGIPDIELAKETGYTTIPQERMGLGLTFIYEYMDDVVLTSQVNQGTKVTMKKNVPNQES